MSRHRDVALRMIDARFEKLLAGNTSAQLHAETSMAVEMAHALGAINVREHRQYVAQQNLIIERQHLEMLARLKAQRT